MHPDIAKSWLKAGKEGYASLNPTENDLPMEWSSLGSSYSHLSCRRKLPNWIINKEPSDQSTKQSTPDHKSNRKKMPPIDQPRTGVNGQIPNHRRNYDGYA